MRQRISIRPNVQTCSHSIRIRYNGAFRSWLLLLAFSSFFCSVYSAAANLNTAHINGRASQRSPGFDWIEKEFLSVLSHKNAIDTSRLYATKPHLAGSEGDLITAKVFLRHLQNELDIDHTPLPLVFHAGSVESQRATRSISKTAKSNAWIDTYYPVLNTPLERSLHILDEDGTLLWQANLEESSDYTDPDAAKYSDYVPAWHGLSPEGDIIAQVIDANYCTQQDYQNLLIRNETVDGSIVLCRNDGGIYRGLKVKGGQELGAVGVLMYSDPIDDGPVTVENGYAAYPHGPARNPTSIQRGSVQYLSVYPGDPTTPGYPSYQNSTRRQGVNIPTIPSLPISWDNAQKVFRTIASNDPWYRKRIRLVNKVDTKVTPIWNVIGFIPGIIKNETIIVGNHRDAWVLGATDPSSGTVSIHEVVRGLGHLLRSGWKPLRTIVIASWDAEEYGLIGSTEWAEDFHDWLDINVVAYLNLDSSVAGSRFRYSGSPLLAHFIRDAALDLQHPSDLNRTLWDARLDVGNFFGNGSSSKRWEAGETAAQAELVDDLGIQPLGSGSDYTVFLQRNGIPCTHGVFGQAAFDPVYHYHSVFDTERWQELYADPGFHKHVAIAQHLGLQIIRLASHIALPFNTTHYALLLDSYLERVEMLAGKKFDPLRAAIYRLQHTSIRLDEVKRQMVEQIGELLQEQRSGNDFAQDGRETEDEEGDEEVDAYVHGILLQNGISTPLPGAARSRIKKLVRRLIIANKKSLAFEKGFISKEGIKDREWYRHLGVAPGKWLGYGATTFPALTEAIAIEKNDTLAQFEAERLEYLLIKLEKDIRI